MVHRRCLYDDAFGVGEALNETAYGDGLVVRGTHFLILGDKTNSMKMARSLSHELYKQPQISFIPTSLSFSEWSALYKTQVESKIPLFKKKLLIYLESSFRLLATIFKPNAASQRQLTHFGNFKSREIFDEVGAYLRCRRRQHFITAGYSVDRGKLAGLIS